MIIVGVSTTRIPSLSNELLRVIGFREASFTKRNRATHERIDIWSRNDIILDRNRSNSIGTSKAVVVVVRKSVVAEINRLSSGIHKPWGILERDGAERESGATPEPPRRLFIVLVFVRVHHESVSVRRCWSSRRCLFRLSTGQVLEEEKGDLISDRDRVCVCAPVNRLTSAYIFRLFRNSLRPILRSRRFTGYGTASKGEGNIRHFDSGFQLVENDLNFTFDSYPPPPSGLSAGSRHYSLSPTPSIRLSFSLSLVSARITRGKMKAFLSSRLDRRKNWRGASFLGRDASSSPFLFIFSLRQIESLCEIWWNCDEIWFARTRYIYNKVFTLRMERNHRLRLRINEWRYRGKNRIRG